MKIKIMSRRNIEDFCLDPMQEQTALISITDFDNTFANLKHKPQFLLQMMFDDVPVGDGFVEEDIEENEDELEETETGVKSKTVPKQGLFSSFP